MQFHNWYDGMALSGLIAAEQAGRSISRRYYFAGGCGEGEAEGAGWGVAGAGAADPAVVGAGAAAGVAACCGCAAGLIQQP